METKIKQALQAHKVDSTYYSHCLVIKPTIIDKEGNRIRCVGINKHLDRVEVFIKFKHAREYKDMPIQFLDEGTKELVYNKIINKENTMTKNVYILFVESNWFNQEPYSDVISVFENEQDAIDALKEYKEDFANKHKERYDETITNNEHYEVTDEPKHFACLDEGMGDNYELWVLEKPLIPKK